MLTCLRHPHVVISNGLFDAPCNECEAEMDQAQAEAVIESAEISKAENPTLPPAGSWAFVAREMAKLYPNDRIDWDAWKDEMKDQD